MIDAPRGRQAFAARAEDEKSACAKLDNHPVTVWGSRSLVDKHNSENRLAIGFQLSHQNA